MIQNKTFLVTYGLNTLSLLEVIVLFLYYGYCFYNTVDNN